MYHPLLCTFLIFKFFFFNFFFFVINSTSDTLIENPDHEIRPMSLRFQFVSNAQSTPLMHCPYCNFTGRGWQKFPKPSTCGKVWAIILTICCSCCCPFCCDCSISWEWMCPACHHLHSEDNPDLTVTDPASFVKP